VPNQPWVSQPYGMPVPPPKKKSKTWLIVLICVLVLALIGGGGSYWYFVMRDDPSKPVAAGHAKTPQAAVRGYLQALAAGSANDALSFVSSVPGDGTFLNDGVLAASNAINPITNIVATQNAGGTKQNATVDATFNIGDTSADVQYSVEQVDKYYFVSNAFGSVKLDGLLDSGVDVNLNGVDVTTASSSQVPLFPGAYETAPANPLLVNTSNSTITVTDPNGMYAPTVTLGTAPDFQTQLATLTDQVLQSCLAEDAIYTSCHFGTQDPYDNTTNEDIVAKPGGANWSYDGTTPDLSGTTFSWDPSDPTTATADVTIKVKLSISATNGYDYHGTFTLTAVTIDFSDPDNPVGIFDYDRTS